MRCRRVHPGRDMNHRRVPAIAPYHGVIAAPRWGESPRNGLTERMAVASSTAEFRKGNMKMLTENRQTAKLLSLGLGVVATLLAGTADAQQRTFHSAGVSMTGPNDRCSEEIWAMNGVAQGPDSHGTFLAIRDNSFGATLPIPLAPADCAAADVSQVLATNYDVAYGAARGWPSPDDRLLNLGLRSIPVPAGNGVRAPIPLPGSVPPNPLPPTISRPTHPITAGNWLAAGGDMTITCDDVENTGTVSATFHNLIPNGVYTLWGAWADATGVVLVVPFGGLPNTVVASQTGAASIHRLLDFCPLDFAPDGSKLQYVSLAYHGDTATYGAVPSEPFATRAFLGFAGLPFVSTIPGGVVTFDQVGFAVNVIDPCPFDPVKTDPGVCGCGVADTDVDLDGTPDCDDGCPADPSKTTPGACGCGVTDTDADLDGTPDCSDLCPNDPNTSAPGLCGCGVAETDTDLDGTPDCNDGCPNDAGKTCPGACGCGVSDIDIDGNGTPGCLDSTCTAPVATASLLLLSGGDGEGTAGGDDDEGRFVVEFGFGNQADACDPPACTGELVCGSMRIAVSPGQIVEIENDDEGCEVEFEGGVLEMEGPDVFLEVTCTNSAAVNTVQAFPDGIGSDNDTDEDEDD